MSEQLPAPDFDAQNYARPNQNWICGRACEGKPCRLGPDNKGLCQATAECSPVLEKKPGEAKGRWRCTRPGGACESGPLPDGSCCRPVAKCSPTPSLRLQRGRLTRAIVAATLAMLLVVFGRGAWRGQFINPGKISGVHSGDSFAAMNFSTNHFTDNCRACHAAGASGLRGLTVAAAHASPGPLDLRGLATAKPSAMTAIDAACQKCHPQHLLHEASVTRDISCAACHTEHHGAKLAMPTDTDCAFCHGNAALMAAAAAKGRSLPAQAFRTHLRPGQLAFETPRPDAGFTQVIHTFAGDHPEFRVRADHLRDPDTLKFNHQLHLTSPNIPLVDGKKLSCEFCHQPDATGAFKKKISFEESCKACHSLQFDVENPDLRVPHGNAASARDFLRSLPAQYAARGAKLPGIGSREMADKFAQAQLARLRAEYGSGEQLERAIFLSDARTGPTARVAGLDATARARFPGCAYCHAVSVDEDNAPQITKPILMDRWLVRGNFNHAKHAQVTCEKCHEARASKDTADIILPTKETCAACHSPKGGASASCSECHSYHANR